MQKLLILFVCVYATAAYRTVYGRYRSDQPATSLPDPAYVLADRIDHATMRLLAATYQTQWNKNLVSSPLGLMTLLSIYDKGAGHYSQFEIDRFLGNDENNPISLLLRNLAVKLSEINPDSLTVADKISISNKYSLNPDFISYALDYHCEVNTLDFSRPNQAAANINRWVAEKTQWRITNLIQPGMLSPATVAALYNVIYFKGHWNVPFKANETKLKTFHLNRNEAVQRPMMHLDDSFYYTESSELDAKLLQLPYREDGFRMVVVLPNQLDGLSSLIRHAAMSGLLKYIDTLHPVKRHVVLDIPKFSIRNKLNFKDILPQVGVHSMFSEAALGIAKSGEVIVSDVLQEAFIEVDEEGSVAGAASAIIMVGASPYSSPVPTFTADHPFLYLILYQNNILFAGTYVGH